jgi:hypothetical protein
MMVEPKVYPVLYPMVNQYIGRCESDKDRDTLVTLRYLRTYIEEWPKRREAELLVASIVYEEEEELPPVMTEEEVQEEVDYVLRTGDIKCFEPAALELVAEGLRRQKKKFIREGDYLSAEKTGMFTNAVISYGHLGEVETMQEQKVREVCGKLQTAENELMEARRHWRQRHEQLTGKYANEIAELKRSQAKLRHKLRGLKNRQVPMHIDKPGHVLLDLRGRLRLALRSRRFEEAGDIKRHIDKLEKEEIYAHGKRWKEEVDFRMQNLKRRQEAEIRVKEMHWKNAEFLLKGESEKAMKRCEMVIDHLKAEVAAAESAKEMATSLKAEKKIVVKEKEAMENMTWSQMEWQRALIHRQRAILNQKIYGIQSRSVVE